ELKDYFLRGMVKREDLPRGVFYLEPQLQRAISHTASVSAILPGQEIEVQVRRVDIERKHLDFVLAQLPN
ncbi:MAG: hypothetical protein AAF585_22445, partial [Verrucomicrobiota bacterium]